MDAGIEVKVEDYDGTYVCLVCGESVRGQPAVKCSHYKVHRPCQDHTVLIPSRIFLKGLERILES